MILFFSKLDFKIIEISNKELSFFLHKNLYFWKKIKDNQLSRISTRSVFTNFTKWLWICLLAGVFSGLLSAIFLVSLKWVTQLRTENTWLLFLLPLGGLLIGFLYKKYDSEITKGNNLIFEAYKNPTQKIALKLAPSILFSTLITHLFGGSAGREGTAVQMSTSIADQLSRWFIFTKDERKTLLLLGISAGFTSVFGTPLAGALFALEILFFSKISIKSVVPVIFTAFIAHFTVNLLGVEHTNYLQIVPFDITLSNLFWIGFASVIFGISALLFSKTMHFITKQFKIYIKNPISRPFVGGIVLVILFQFEVFSKFIGLGVPEIQAAFVTQSGHFDFVLKLAFTAFTLGCGFKGGEVTPLFFIGATLGSALSGFIPLPIAVLAAVGFVAVFAGATHTPIASTVMAMELFGLEIGLFAAIGCFVAYLFSGKNGIYSSQNVGGFKIWVYKKFGL
jgi:H+/Cl- antiporter ClcA